MQIWTCPSLSLSGRTRCMASHGCQRTLRRSWDQRVSNTKMATIVVQTRSSASDHQRQARESGTGVAPTRHPHSAGSTIALDIKNPSHHSQRSLWTCASQTLQSLARSALGSSSGTPKKYDRGICCEGCSMGYATISLETWWRLQATSRRRTTRIPGRNLSSDS